MSTRCNIIVKENETTYQYYHHCDGYPSGVGAELNKVFAQEFRNRKGDEVILANDVMTKLATENADYEFEDCYYHPHGDIEYLYEIVQNADSIKMTCYEYDEINDWDRDEEPNYKPLCQQREVCSWTYNFKSWSTWRKEGEDKLTEMLDKQ